MIEFTDKQMALVMGEPKLDEKTNFTGGKYFVATQHIGSIFGSGVEGHCQGT